MRIKCPDIPGPCVELSEVDLAICYRRVQPRELNAGKFGGAHKRPKTDDLGGKLF